MRRGTGNSRKFDGKWYRFYGGYRSEADAKTMARCLRWHGDMARVTKGTHGGGKTSYNVWTRFRP